MLVGDLIRRKSSLAKRAWITLFERRNIERAAAVHLTSEIEASELRALGFPHARLAIVANGIEMPSVTYPATISTRLEYASPLCAVSGPPELEKGSRSPDTRDERGRERRPFDRGQ